MPAPGDALVAAAITAAASQRHADMTALIAVADRIAGSLGRLDQSLVELRASRLANHLHSLVATALFSGLLDAARVSGVSERAIISDADREQLTRVTLREFRECLAEIDETG